MFASLEEFTFILRALGMQRQGTKGQLQVSSTWEDSYLRLLWRSLMLTSFGNVFRGVGSLFCVLGVKEGAQRLHTFCRFCCGWVVMLILFCLHVLDIFLGQIAQSFGFWLVVLSKPSGCPPLFDGRKILKTSQKNYAMTRLEVIDPPHKSMNISK